MIDCFLPSAIRVLNRFCVKNNKNLKLSIKQINRNLLLCKFSKNLLFFILIKMGVYVSPVKPCEFFAGTTLQMMFVCKKA
ncbi:hypothetical protein MNBD_GAMMA11-1034 [hydrothermal vent metagenome]|uniref:Uncharacterized protein n=1 Tax=hydrothermal vent metagenome TaxID=652676 RepID=A0A3B0X9P0_9ZZZZ